MIRRAMAGMSLEDGGSDGSDEEMEHVEVKKSAFAALMDDAGDSLPSDNSDDEEEKKPKKEVVKKEAVKKEKKKKKKGKGADDDDDEFGGMGVDDAPPAEDKGGKKKKKKKKKGDDDDEDLDAMLAALRAEYTGDAPPEDEAASSKPAAQEENKKKKKKESSPQEDDGDDASKLGFEVIDDEDVEAEGGTVKTAAQKKKEKKAKQLQKLKEEKEKERKGGKPQAQEEKKSEAVKEATPENEGEGEGEEEKDDKKGKKKKGKKEKEEEEAKKKKKPNKAILAAMAETLAKQKEEEERLRAEEEERERLEEERVAAAIAAKQREEEKRAAKKEREKQKKDQLKAEGKWLTPAQKAAKARADAALEAMRAQGAEVPVAGEKKLTMKERAKLKKQNKSRHVEQAAASKETTPEKVVEEKVEEVKVEESKEPEKAAEEEEDVLDNWMDADDSDKEEEAKKNQSEKKEKASPEGEQVGGDEDSEEEESEDEEDEEESESEEESSSEEEEEDLEETDGKTLAEIKRERAIARIKDRMKKNAEAKSKDNLRSPVVCVLGHVDTGKTKILDKLRRTSVQDGEAGGITQQIGATNVPIAVIKEQCKMVHGFLENPLRLPGLLIIDTPGHESFSNLRDRGSSLCDIAILVIDIMHSLEPQTIESLNLLKKKKTPFVVALNKIDRLYEWKPNRHKDVREVLEMQGTNTKLEFQKKKDEVLLGLAEQGLNAALFWENPDPEEYISLVPTSAHSGDGMGNLMGQLVEISQTRLEERLSFSEELQATVLEVKAIGGFGTTIDVVLVNGRLKFGQTIVLTGTEGPIVTTVKALLTPSKMQDLRVKCGYTEHKELMAAQGVKIAAKELDKAIAGLSMRVANNPDEVEILKEACERDLASALNAIKLKPLGVFVQASTLGSLEALLEFLKTSKIPYAGVRIGPVVRKDVMRASTMLEHEEKYACILAFDVKVERDAQEMADREGVKIFQADIIYHLFDRFTEYQADIVKKKKEQFGKIAVFPCKLKMLPDHIYTRRDPIVAGVKVEAGIIKCGTPLCVPSKEFIYLGICTSLQKNEQDVPSARKGEEVCIKIESPGGDAPKMFGRHFDDKDMVISKISRESIDACKDWFRDDLQKSDWALMVELKKLFEIL